MAPRDEGMAGVVHTTADVLHLLAASAWIGALAVLGPLALASSRRGAVPGADHEALKGLKAFSAVGVGVVAVLVASGLVNTWLLVGPGGVGRLPTTPYGQLLLIKLAIFGLMLLLAAANRYWLTPRLERRRDGDSGALLFRPVILSVLAETVLAILVLGLVSWLGTLPSPIDG